MFPNKYSGSHDDFQLNINKYLREAEEKKSSLNGRAGGGGAKGLAIKEKRTFFGIFLKILLPFKNKIILL